MLVFGALAARLTGHRFAARAALTTPPVEVVMPKIPSTNRCFRPGWLKAHCHPQIARPDQPAAQSTRLGSNAAPRLLSLHRVRGRVVCIVTN